MYECDKNIGKYVIEIKIKDKVIWVMTKTDVTQIKSDILKKEGYFFWE